MKKILLHLGLALLSWNLVTDANAQLIEDVVTVRERTDAVLRIRFSVPIQYLRNIKVASGDLVQIFYQLAPGSELPVVVVYESRNEGGGQLPKVKITNEAIANEATRKLVVRFSEPSKFKVRAGPDNRSIDIVIVGAGSRVRVSDSSANFADGQYAVNLQASAAPGTRLPQPVPAEFQSYTVFTSQVQIEGKTRYEINLGYFATKKEADRARNRLSARFKNAAVIDLAARKFSALSGTTAPPELDAQATELLMKAKSESDAGDFDNAVSTLNQLLILPPNASSQEAQELIGVAREKSGDITKSKAEYELYLKLFPEGEAAERVKQRIAGLASAPALSKGRAAQVGPMTTVSGSVSQYYYGGVSQSTTLLIDTPLAGVPRVIGSDDLSTVDQSQIATNIDLNWRHRDLDSDMRFVFRDTNSLNFLSTGKSSNKLSALYYDYKSLPNNFSARIGRQSSSGGGVLGRFDGVLLGYGIAPKWRVNAVTGRPSEKLFDTRRSFYGLSIDAENLGDNWSGNAFVIEQKVDGESDRRALGGDVRYFSANMSLYSLLDYDVLYHKLNIASVQGTWQTEGQSTFNFLADRRTTPTMQTSNALIPAATRMIKDLLATKSIAEIQALALSTTAYVNQFLAGFTTPLSPKWQIGADARLTNIGELPAFKDGSTDIPKQAGTGNVYSFSLQSIGTNLLSSRDTHVFNLTYITAPTYKGQLLSYNNLSVLAEKWQLEPSVKYYHQTDDSGTKIVRITPGLRLSYRLRENVSFESEVNAERSRSTSSTLENTSNRTFFYAGYRVDF